MTIAPDISRRIAIAKLLLVFGIVITHIPPYLELSNLSFTAPETIKAFFAHAFFRAAVPLLAAISGYLLFSSKLHLDIKRPKHQLQHQLGHLDTSQSLHQWQ